MTTLTDSWFSKPQPTPVQRLEAHDDLFLFTWILRGYGATVALVFSYLCWFRWYRDVQITKDPATYSFIAEKLGLHYGTVYSAIQRLCHAKLISKEGDLLTFLDSNGQVTNPDLHAGEFLRLPRDWAAKPKSELSSEGKAILAAILANQTDGRCSIGLQRIADITGVSFASAEKWANALARMGICQKSKQGKRTILDLDLGKVNTCS